MKKLFVITIMTIVTSISNNVIAAPITTTQQATATLASSCILTTTDINFGSISANPTIQMVQATGNIALTCSKNLSYNIALNLGANQTSGGRRLLGATKGEKIGYTICPTANWNGTIAANTYQCADGLWYSGNIVSGTGNGSLQNVPTYGIVPSGFYTPDTYSDTTTVTITY